MSVLHQKLFTFWPLLDPCFILVGDGRSPQSNRVAQIYEVVENVTDRCTRPRTWMQRIAPMVRFPGFLKVVICRCQNLLFCQNPRDLTRTFSGSTEGKDLPHDLCYFRVRLEMRWVVLRTSCSRRAACRQAVRRVPLAAF